MVSRKIGISVSLQRAISKAINRDAIVAKVMEGNAIPAGQVLPEGFFAISPNLKPEEAGYGGTNRGRYSNKEFDAVLEEALRTVDRNKHEALLIKATEMAIGDLGIIPLHFQVAIWAMQDGLTYTARTDEYTLATAIRKAK